MSEETSGVIVDRSRMSYGESKRSALIGMMLRRAEKENDWELAERAMNESSQLMERIVTAVPEEFFVEGAPPEALRLESGWVDWIRSDRIEIISEAMSTKPGEKKTASVMPSTSKNATPAA